MTILNRLPLNQILCGDSLEILRTLPDKSVHLIFADPPYNLQLQNDLIRPNLTRVDAVDDEWDKFDDFAAYDAFTRAWLSECRRILRDDGAIWVIGTYHNIYRVGYSLMNLGYWILSECHWHKPNAMPNFRGTRFTNSSETLIWAKKSAEQKRYTFNYHAMKHFNDGKQMTNVWEIPICTGPERIKVDGKKAHPTQKPEALLYRVLLAATHVGDIVLDPFFGTGTTGAVAKKMKRQFIGIEREPQYVEIANQRIAHIAEPDAPLELFITPSKRHLPRLKLGQLISAGYLQVGQKLYAKNRAHVAIIKADSSLVCGTFSGSIHKVASLIVDKAGANGWDFWYYEDSSGALVTIDEIRQRYVRENDAAQALKNGEG